MWYQNSGMERTTERKPETEFCTTFKQRADIDVDPADILAIHRVPKNRTGWARPVIVRMISTNAKTNITRHDLVASNE